MGGCVSTAAYVGEEKKIVVVGGGFGGVKLCHEMAKTAHNLQITILSPNDALDIAWASPRAIADPKSANRNVVPFASIFKSDRIAHVHDAAASVSKTAVTTASGKVLPYDVLVIATGATYPEGSAANVLKTSDVATTGAKRVKELRDLGAQVASSKGVMIVGAGLSGLEVAGEIATAHPSVPVKLISSKGALGDGMPPAIGKKLKSIFDSKKNVSVLLNTRATAADAAKYGCDIVFMCTGMQPRTEFIKSGELASVLDSKGFVKTTPTLQVQGFPNVFSFGDCARPGQGPTMSGFHTGNAAKTVVAPNIVKLLNSEKKLTENKPSPDGGIILLSKKEGTGYFDKSVLPGFIVTMMKGPDLFRGKETKELTGLNAPILS